MWYESYNPALKKLVKLCSKIKVYSDNQQNIYYTSFVRFIANSVRNNLFCLLLKVKIVLKLVIL